MAINQDNALEYQNLITERCYIYDSNNFPNDAASQHGNLLIADRTIVICRVLRARPIFGLHRRVMFRIGAKMTYPQKAG